MLMFRVSKRDRTVVLAVSTILFTAQIITIIVNELYFKVPLIFTPDQLLFLTMIVTIFPPAAANYFDLRWRSSVDRNIPEFLRELSEAGRTGITLTRALELASKRRYGPLSSELERIVNKLSWGGSLEEALKDFAERVGTRLAKRTSILLSEINRAGGDIRDVLDMVSKHIRELQVIQEERMSQLRIYVVIVYVAFFIFLFIDYVILETFLSKIELLRAGLKEAGGVFAVAGLDLRSIKTIMFHMSVIQGLFGGLVAGKMGEGSLGAGLKHSAILMSISLIVFYYLM
ncbi:MAG: type II secretion system F family protein [Candidatus Bathyarchaeia archaeon]